MTKNVLVILAPGFEETEAITVIDILKRAGIQVITAGLEENPIVGSHGIPVLAMESLSEVKNLSFDAVVLPGGMRGVENMLQSRELLSLVDSFSRSSENATIAAICAAPLVLDKLNLLTPYKFTCHPCVYDRLNTPIELTDKISAPYVIYRNIVTGRSAGCAMIWALALVKHLTGEIDSLMSGLRLPDQCQNLIQSLDEST